MNQRKFLKISLVVSITLIVALIFLGISIYSNHISGQGTYWDWSYVFLIPAIILSGISWFVWDIFRYIKTKEYLVNNISIKKNAILSGLLWLFLIVLFTVISLWFLFDGICKPFVIWNGTREFPCTFDDYLFKHDFFAGLLFFTSLYFSISILIIMFIIGFASDIYIKKNFSAK